MSNRFKKGDIVAQACAMTGYERDRLFELAFGVDPEKGVPLDRKAVSRALERYQSNGVIPDVVERFVAQKMTTAGASMASM